MSGLMQGVLRTGRVGMAILAGLGSLGTAAMMAQRAAPVRVAPFHGQYCRSMAPRGWAFTGENAQRVAFGADSMSPDGKAAASYAIFGAGTAAPIPGFETPERAVAMNLSLGGAERIRFGQRMQFEQGVYAVSFQRPTVAGIAYYRVFPMQRNGYIVLMRSAYTPTAEWRNRGAEASAVARSMACNVPMVPAAPDPPSLNTKRRSADEGKEADSEYNVWLDKEYYHNERTGENFWVSPSQDFDQNGHQGPGYYAKSGNEIVKLVPGYAQ